MRSDGKTCSRCERTLPFEDFAVRRASSDGRQNYCRSCHSDWTRSRRPRKLRDAPPVGPDEKWCRRCGLIKPRSDFAANKSARDGLQGSCRACGAAAYRDRRVSAGFQVRPGEIPLGRKYCRSCDTVKPVSQWSRNASASDGLQTRCRDCASSAGRTDHLSRTYGMTSDDVSDLLAQQDGRCAICLVAEAIHIDHDHVDGRIRGMLCFRCNAALGQLGDDVDVIRRAADYLEGRVIRMRRIHPSVVQITYPPERVPVVPIAPARPPLYIGELRRLSMQG